MVVKELSQREQTFTAIAFQCMKEKPQIDWAKFADMAKLKNAKSARDSFRPIMEKVLALNEQDETEKVDEAEEPDTPKAATAKKTRKRKGDADDNEDEASPKTKKATPKKARTTKSKNNKDTAESTVKDEQTDGEIFD